MAPKRPDGGIALISPFGGSNPPAPAKQSGAQRKCPRYSQKGPPMAGFCELATSLQAPILGILRAKLPIVSGGHLKNSRFWETAAGDRLRSALRGRPFIVRFGSGYWVHGKHFLQLLHSTIRCRKDRPTRRLGDERCRWRHAVLRRGQSDRSRATTVMFPPQGEHVPFGPRDPRLREHLSAVSHDLLVMIPMQCRKLRCD
jgi:hypothetical protein